MNQAKPKIRLFVRERFSAGHMLELDKNQSHYLAQVMRVSKGDGIAVFNGSDGVWRAEVAQLGRKSVTLQLVQQISPQKPSPDMWLAFAPIKNKTDIVVEKAVELGVSRLLTVITRHAVVRSINHEKLMAHAIEAAEQCERCDVPEIKEYHELGVLLSEWPSDRILLYGDESGGGVPLRKLIPTLPKGKYGVLVGPEGGFSSEEHHMLKNWGVVKAFGMGPRILRADTAAIAALACLQAWLGDWDEQPHFDTGEDD